MRRNNRQWLFLALCGVVVVSSNGVAAEPIRPEGAPSAVPNVVRSPSRAAAPGIRLEVPEGMTTREAWRRHFTDKQEEPAAVRAATRKLMDEQKFGDVVDLILGALAAGQPQPWMYEALALSLQAQDAPTSEVERALMSAVDFSASPEALMYAALYMAESGLEQRALQLFREVSSVAPQRPEPYAHGLELAARLQDVDALQWACTGVLSRAWPADQRALEQRAFRVAQATLNELNKRGEKETAAAFRKQLDSALVRDCIVRVRWTGDADIDILVQEPSGTICSLATPLTTAGGVLSGDAFSRLGDAKLEGYAETYTCAEAFGGEYRMLLRRVWGKVAAGKVTIDIYTGYGTDQQRHIHREVQIGEKDAVVLFDVPQGRRQESLEEHQVATIANNQLAVGRAILAQQLNTVAESQAAVELELARRELARRGLLGGRNPRNVGYRPVITTLPEGANMTATAVISADRRYVRITAIPLFSLIGDVTTFNFQTGDTQVNPDMNADAGADAAPAPVP